MSAYPALAAEKRAREYRIAQEELERSKPRMTSRGTRRTPTKAERLESKGARTQAVGRALEPILTPLEDAAVRGQELARMLPGSAGAYGPLMMPIYAARNAKDWSVGESAEAARAAAGGDPNAYFQDTEPTMRRARGGMMETGGSMPTQGLVDTAFLGSDIAGLGASQPVKNVARYAATEMVPGMVEDLAMAGVRGSPGISPPVGGRGQLGLLGNTLPKTNPTLDEMTAAVGYEVGSSPGIYTYPEGSKVTKVPTRLDPAEAKAIKEYERQMTEDYGAPTAQKLADKARRDIVAYRETHHPREGWAKATPASIETGETGPEIAYKAIAPRYHIDPKTDSPYVGVARAQAVEDVSNRLVAEVQDVVNRAGAGERNAQFIVDQSRWYNDAQRTIQDAFGVKGGKLYSNIQGSMSPNTKLSDQHKMAQEFFERLINGDFDEKLAKFDAHMAKKPEGAGDSDWARRLYDERKPEYDPDAAPRKLNGKLFGIHSADAMLAARGMLGAVEPGMVPKMRNFAGNLGGTSVDPTIDMWADRTINRLMGGLRIPAEAKTGVRGKMAQPSDMLGVGHYDNALRQRAKEIKAEEMGRKPPKRSKAHIADAQKTPDPMITGQYGMARDIFSTAAAKLGMDADDLQALMWFYEKEMWERNGWVSMDKSPSLVDLIRKDNPPGSRTDELRALAEAYAQ